MAVWVQHRQNTSWEPVTIVTQSSSNSYWIMQENGTDQPKMYKRSMLKIRCTDIQPTRQEYSRFAETEKAKFQTPSTYHDDRNFVWHNSVKKFSPDLVHPTKTHTSSASDSIFSERREEITEDIPAPAEDVPAPAPPAPAPTLETLQDQESQQEVTLGSQPVHIVTFTCRHYFDLDYWRTSTTLNFVNIMKELWKASTVQDTLTSNFFQDH